MHHHESRIGAISLASNKLLTGSRDKKIKMFDLRQGTRTSSVYECHDQEVCGLKWSPNGEYFCSGGNDNKFFVYSLKTNVPIIKKTHKAAVKALAWSPNNPNVLATGAGCADRKIRIWDVSLT